MFAKIAVLALIAASMISTGTEAQYLAAPAYGYAAYPSYAAYSPYYYGAYSGYAAAYPSYWGWGSNKNGAPAAAKPAPGVSLTNNQ